MISASVHRKRVVYLFDRLMIGYPLLMTLLILLFGQPLGGYIDEIIVYTALSGLSALIVYYVDEHNGRWSAFIRLVYPAIMFGIYYRMTGGMMFLLFDQFLDWQLITFERMIFGVNPTLFIDKGMLNVWTNEIFMLGYFLYYPMLPVFTAAMFIRRDYAILKQVVLAAAITFFVSYLLFSLYPVEGPRWYFAEQFTNVIEGPVFRTLVESIQHRGAVHGGCVPSSHVAVALLIMMFCFKYYRPFGWILVPVNILLTIGTFWGRYHYVSDAIFGAAIGVTATLWTWRYYDRLNLQTSRSIEAIEERDEDRKILKT